MNGTLGLSRASASDPLLAHHERVKRRAGFVRRVGWNVPVERIAPGQKVRRRALAASPSQPRMSGCIVIIFAPFPQNKKIGQDWEL